jgi:hypothetical protein
MNREQTFQFLSILFFITGCLMAMAIIVLGIVANVESLSFSPTPQAEKQLSNVRCPLLISSTEKGTIRGFLRNTTKYAVRPTVQFFTTIGPGFNVNYSSQQLIIEPGEKGYFTKTVGIEDAVYDGRLIMARVFVAHSGSYLLPNATATCGTVVLDLGDIPGTMLLVIIAIFSISALVAGWLFWHPVQLMYGKRSGEAVNSLRTLSIVVFIGAGSVLLLGWWFLGVIAGIISVLLIVILLSRWIFGG